MSDATCQPFAQAVMAGKLSGEYVLTKEGVWECTVLVYDMFLPYWRSPPRNWPPAFPAVPATNPYDPEFPLEQQKKAEVFGFITGNTMDGSVPALLRGAEITLASPTTPSNSPLFNDAETPPADPATGASRFSELIPGIYTLAVSQPGYLTKTRDLMTGPGEKRQADVILIVRPAGGWTTAGRITGVVTLKSSSPDHLGTTAEVRHRP